MLTGVDRDERPDPQRSSSPATPAWAPRAMGASVLRKKIQAAGYDDVKVVNKSIANLTDTYDVVVTHQDLTDRARQRTGRRCTSRWTTS